MSTTPSEVSMRLLREARTIAVVGISSDSSRPSYEVTQYLIAAGYTVYLVNPAEAGPILGLPVYDSVAELPEQVDIVDVFRRPEFVPPVVDDAIVARAGAVWMQLGIINESAATTARAAGLEVVMDRCMKIDHAALVARGEVPGVGAQRA